MLVFLNKIVLIFLTKTVSIFFLKTIVRTGGADPEKWFVAVADVAVVCCCYCCCCCCYCSSAGHRRRFLLKWFVRLCHLCFSLSLPLLRTSHTLPRKYHTLALFRYKFKLNSAVKIDQVMSLKIIKYLKLNSDKTIYKCYS